MTHGARSVLRPPGWALSLGAAALVVTAVTALIYPLQKLDPGVSSGVLYVLGVLLVSVYWGLRLGLATSLASVVALEYFHTDPVGGFGAKDPGDLVAISTLLLTCVVAAVIADRARQRAESAEERLRLEEALRARDAERIRLEEVRASRARVMAAADAERRRVVRHIHNGAQQRMVHTVVILKLTRQALEPGSVARPLVDEALENAERATDELRELAHEMLPAALTRGGIRGGVNELASRTAIPVEVDVDVGRLPTVLEATAYFVVAEALANVAKHSEALRSEVTARIRDGVLHVRVRDYGIGGALQAGGNGLVGLEDRLAVLGGELRVESPNGGGTTVEAAIPLLTEPPGQ